MTRWLLVLAMCAATALPAQVPTRTPADAPPVDFRWEVTTLDGARQSLEGFRGRVVILNAWATWCEPCVAELQSFSALRAAVPDADLVFAMVASQRPEPVRDFVRRRRLSLPVYLERTPMPAVYGFDAVPTTWVIDRAGRLAFRHRGAMRWDTPAVQSLVRTLLADTASIAAGNHTARTP